MCGPPTPTQSPLVYHTHIQPSCGARAMLQSLRSNVLHCNQKHLALRLGMVTTLQHINEQTTPHRGPIIVGLARIYAFFLFFFFAARFYHCCKTRDPRPNLTVQYRLYEHNFTNRHYPKSCTTLTHQSCESLPGMGNKL